MISLNELNTLSEATTETKTKQTANPQILNPNKIFFLNSSLLIFLVDKSTSIVAHCHSLHRHHYH